MNLGDISPIADLATSKKVLDRHRIGATLRASMRLEVQQDVVLDELIYRLTAEVLGDRLASETYSDTKFYSRPATTWHMFKETHKDSWWLRWLVQRRPVKMLCEPHTVTVELQRNFVYPEATIALPQLGRPFIYEQIIPGGIS